MDSRNPAQWPGGGGLGGAGCQRHYGTRPTGQTARQVAASALAVVVRCPVQLLLRLGLWFGQSQLRKYFLNWFSASDFQRAPSTSPPQPQQSPRARPTRQSLLHRHARAGARHRLQSAVRLARLGAVGLWLSWCALHCSGNTGPVCRLPASMWPSSIRRCISSCTSSSVLPKCWAISCTL